MIETGEILQTMRMIREENFDIRTITLGLNLLDCSGQDAEKTAQRCYDKVCRFGERLVAVGEEILFRGILFRWIDSKWGFVPALIVSALFFGVAHIFQPGASWWSSIAIAIEAGLLLAAAYKYSGTLWLPIGIHWGWNFFQGNIFGIEVSDSDAGESLIIPEISGPDILTGGAFGAEASIVAFLLGLALSVWFIVKVVKKK